MPKIHPLHRHVQRLAKQLAKGLIPSVDRELGGLLSDNPDWVMDSLEGFTKALALEESAHIAAYGFLLSQQLEFLRYGVDRGRTQDIERVEQFQYRVIELARQGQLSNGGVNQIAVLLRHAKLAPLPEMFEVAAELMQDEPPAAIMQITQLSRIFGELADTVHGDPFEVARGVSELCCSMPTDALGIVSEMLMHEQNEALREAVPLLILDERPKVRQILGRVLHAHAKNLSPVSLRRLITLRNWLPESERKTIDETIKTARRSGIECASWPEPPPVEFLASCIDGSGAQGLFLMTQSGRKHQLFSILLRLGKGVLDASTLPDLTKKQRDAILEDVSSQMEMTAVTSDYVDRTLQHHLAAASLSGTLPPIDTLKVAETVGGLNWLQQPIDLDAAIDQWLREVPSKLLTSAAVKEILQSSALWAGHTGISKSWFEDDQAVETLLAGTRARKPETLVNKILKEIIEPRARLWAERCFWAALWCREAPDDIRIFWPHFLIVAKALIQGHPLKDISLMTAIAEETFEGALYRV